MNYRDIAVLMDGIAPVLRGYVEKAFEPIGQRILALEEQFKALPAPRDGKDADPVLILRLVEETVAKIPPAPAGPAGQDADPALVAELVDKAVAALEPAKDGAPGKDADPERVAEIISESMAAIISDEVRKTLEVWSFPAAEKGEPGEPGKSVTLDDVRPVLEELVAQIPPAAAGKDADPVEVAALIIEDVAKLIPAPADGKSVTVDELAPLVDGAVLRRVGELPVAKDGTDGKDGAPGRDGRDGLPGIQGEKGLDGRHGADGKDGLGIDDFDVKAIDDGRALELSLKREGAEPIIKRVDLATVLDRGVWREQGYAKGDGVTWGGSFFIAQRATGEADKPGNSDGWRLSVKKGRDGKDGAPGKPGDRGPEGKAGRDMTQRY